VFDQPRLSAWSVPALAAGIVWISTAVAAAGLVSIPPGVLGAILVASGGM
jgi:hypothetical protein